MKRYSIMGRKDGKVILCDSNCPKCYGTGCRGQIVSCAKNKNNEGKYIPCSCVRTQPIDIVDNPAVAPVAPAE